MYKEFWYTEQVLTIKGSKRKKVFTGLLYLIAFILVVFTRQDELSKLKGSTVITWVYIDLIIYGLQILYSQVAVRFTLPPTSRLSSSSTASIPCYFRLGSLRCRTDELIAVSGLCSTNEHHSLSNTILAMVWIRMLGLLCLGKSWYVSVWYLLYAAGVVDRQNAEMKEIAKRLPMLGSWLSDHLRAYDPSKDQGTD